MLTTPPPAPEPDAATEPAVAPLRFREGMSRVAGSVHAVTTDGPAGRAGFTATAVAPVTDSPASLLVCINASGRSAQRLLRNGVFCVNTLGIADQAVAEAFTGRTGLVGAQRFTVGAWGRLVTGAPVLETALVAFDCRVLEADLVATHYVMIGAVAEVRIGPGGAALMYYGRDYHAL